MRPPSPGIQRQGQQPGQGQGQGTQPNASLCRAPRSTAAGLRAAAACALPALLLAGCGEPAMVLDPKGPIAAGQRELIVAASLLCAAILVPVLILTAWIVFRYRDSESNRASYRPNWSHNTVLETVWWIVPVVLIAVLAVITVRGTYALEPSRPIESDRPPLVIQVTSLDWKWLFQYPEQGIATVNYARIPQGVPIRFELTSDAPMNSFWVPQLGGQIYTMSGMAMTLYLQADEPGAYFGSGANFSGEHFADMTFDVVAEPEAQFHAWVEQVKEGAPALTPEGYAALARPGTAEAQSFSSIPEGLFHSIVTKYAAGEAGGHAHHADTHHGGH